MNAFVSRFFSFDKMIGTSLVKLLYFFGMVIIAFWTVRGMIAATGLMGTSFLAGLGGLLLAPVFGFIGLLFWRFSCELFILFFKLSDDVSAIRLQKEASN